jgi:hypothetical protein
MLSRKDFLPPLMSIAEVVSETLTHRRMSPAEVKDVQDKALEIVAVDLFVRLTEARAISPLFWVSFCPPVLVRADLKLHTSA